MDVVASSKLSGGLFGGQAPANGGNDLATQTPEPLTHDEWLNLKEEVRRHLDALGLLIYGLAAKLAPSRCQGWDL